MADYQTFKKLYYSAHHDSGLATSNIVSSSPRCYKIYWFIMLKDLFVSDMLNNFVSSKLWDVLFWGRGSDLKGQKGAGGQKCPFLGDVLNGCFLKTFLFAGPCTDAV